MTYTVISGDTLHSVARKFGVSLNDLITANPQIENPQLIYPGQVLSIPTGQNSTHHKLPQDMSHSRFHKMIPRLPEPYPDIRVEAQNPHYALILHEAYAGKVSEITAIMQYTYHHLEMEFIPNWKEVSELESGISIIEMEHMETLGELILLLGGIPRYHDSAQLPWQPDYVAYHDFDPCAQLRADIAAEQAAIMNYQEQIRMIDDRYIQAILRRIIKDEEHHIELFTEQLERLCKI